LFVAGALLGFFETAFMLALARTDGLPIDFIGMPLVQVRTDVLPVVIIFIGLAVLYGVMAYGLWTLRLWSRVTTIGVSVLMPIGWLDLLWTRPGFNGAESFALTVWFLIALLVFSVVTIAYLCKSSVKILFT